MNHKNQKTTVLFVNKNSRAIKPIQVSNTVIANWKKYIFLVSLFFIGLIGIIVYLASCNLQQGELRAALSTKLIKMSSLISQVDTAAMRKKFTKIDTELTTINDFLRARGIKPAITQGQGGEMENDIISSTEISTFYEGYLKRIIHDISYTPLGLPFHGSVTSTFGHRENPFGGNDIETHKGLDISGPTGAPVKAMAKGEVAFAGTKGGFGNCIVLKHDNGFETLYGHLSKILVHPGEQIEVGEQIGDIGSTGRSTGPHLHYEVHRYGQKIDPKNFLTLN